MLLLSRSEIERLLDLDALRDAVARAMVELSAGTASMPQRIAAVVPARDALLAAMPAYLPSAGALTTKLVSLFPRNTDRPTHQAVIVVFDPDNGTPVAFMDGEAITAARTAAGSALATDLLARRDATVLAVVGTGVQARAHLRAMPRVRRFREVRVVGRDGARAAISAAPLRRRPAQPRIAIGHREMLVPLVRAGTLGQPARADLEPPVIMRIRHRKRRRGRRRGDDPLAQPGRPPRVALAGDPCDLRGLQHRGPRGRRCDDP